MGPGTFPAGSGPLILTRRDSPNCGPRRDGAKPDIVVIHYTAMASAAAAAETLCNPKTEVSAHYLIARDGEVMSLVPEDMRAWHAGAGRWGAVTDVNSRSIGIELDHPGQGPFDPRLMASLRQVLRGIMARWRIRPERVIGHSDMAPGRKIDPGPQFDWRSLARTGLSIWPGRMSGPTVPAGQFRPLAQRFGYTADVPDEVLLGAFRLRFRPGVVGPLDQRDLAMLADLAARYPVDAARTWA